MANTDIPPLFTHTIALEEPLVERIREVLSAAATRKRLDEGYALTQLVSLDDFQLYHTSFTYFDGHLWLAHAGQLTQFEPAATAEPDAGASFTPGQTWTLPDQRELASAIGLTDLEPADFKPAFGMRSGQMMWWLCGYQHHAYRGLPVVFNPAREPHWRPIGPEQRSFLDTSGIRALVHESDDLAWLYGTIDAGAAAHLDDFIDMPTCYRIDLRAGTHSYEGSKPVPAGPHGPAVPLFVTAAFEEIVIARDNPLSVDWELADAKRFVGTLEEDYEPLPDVTLQLSCDSPIVLGEDEYLHWATEVALPHVVGVDIFDGQHLRLRYWRIPDRG